MTILVTGLVCGSLSMVILPWADLAITSLGSMEEKKERSSVKAGLILGGGLPSIPSELLRRVKEIPTWK